MTHHPVDLQPPDITEWQQGTHDTPFVHHFDSGHMGPHVVICALMHGNEFCGAIALDQLLRAKVRPRRGRLTLAFCNVGAFGHFDAQNPNASRSIDEDMNRVWGAERLQAQTQEAQRAASLLPWVSHATHLLDLHSMSESKEPLLMVGQLARNQAFGEALGTGVRCVADAGHADGTRLRDFEAYGDPESAAIALLLEAGQHWDVRSVGVTQRVLGRFLLRTQSLDADDLPPGFVDTGMHPQPPSVHVHGRVVARSSRVELVHAFEGGETIAKAGTVIGHDDGTPIATPFDDCVLVMPSPRQARPGVTVLRFGRMAAATGA